MKKYLWILFLSFCCFFSSSSWSDETADISAQEAKTAVNNIIKVLENHYIKPDKVKPAIRKLKSLINTARFKNGIDFYDFKSLIETSLYNASSDSGFELTHDFIGSAADDHEVHHYSSSMEMRGKNIGYLELSGIHTLADYDDFIDKAFVMYRDVDALVIDIRHADEGRVELTQKLLGFFMDANTSFAKVKFADKTVELKPIETKPKETKPKETKPTHSKGVKLLHKDLPIYIVQSAFVAGSWELFSAVMQRQRHASIVGQLSMGVGYIDNKRKVSDTIFFSMTEAVFKPANIASASAAQISPSFDIWDGYGVVPDFPTDNKKSLDKAFELASKHLR